MKTIGIVRRIDDLGRIVIIFDTVKINDNYLIYINNLLTKIIEFMDKKNSDTNL